MAPLHYIASILVTVGIADTVIEGEHIKIGDLVYVRLSKKPKGKIVKRKLLSTISEEQFIIYG